MFEELKENLEGCFYTIFTPFKEDESIDYEALEKYLTILYRQGARRFYAMAYNSRYSQLTDEEIKSLNAFCIETVKRLDSKSIVIVGDPIHCSTRVSKEFTQHAKDAGADLISLLVREKYFSDEQILEHYSECGSVDGIGLLVHEMPFLSGKDGSQIQWPISLLEKLKGIPQIAALKEDAKNYELTSAALALEPDIRVIIAGTKKSFMPYRELGAKAYLNGISIINAEIGEAFWEAYKKNDVAEIEFILDKLEAPFFEQCCAKYGWHRCNKALLEAAGFMHRRDRMPLKHLNDSEYLTVVETYNQISEAMADWKA